MSKNLCALILAGGKGTRFWPLSTEEKPKQFLNLIGDETMIQMTVNRIKPIIPIERIFVCTGAMYVDLVKEQLPNLPERNIIIEPEGRNTAPCITLSALVIKKHYKNSNMVVLPSDHLINNEEVFRNIVLEAESFIEKNNNAIITLGMEPTRPETGYGYIECDKSKHKISEYEVVKVNKFVEKPNREVAKEYIDNGNYLWNGGMFIWTVENILNKIKIYSPITFEALHEIEYVEEVNLQNLINKNYGNTESISIDYAVLEKSQDIYVIPSEFGWDDIGSWTSIDRYKDKDVYGNVFNSKGILYKSQNNIVVTRKKTLLNNVDNLIVVETEDYLMISSKENEQEIKLAKQRMG